jgi:hypothetical protein
MMHILLSLCTMKQMNLIHKAEFEEIWYRLLREMLLGVLNFSSYWRM